MFNGGLANTVGTWVAAPAGGVPGVLDGSKFYAAILNILWNRQVDTANAHHSWIVSPPPAGTNPPPVSIS